MKKRFLTTGWLTDGHRHFSALGISDAYDLVAAFGSEP
jgi:hypothetical protein